MLLEREDINPNLADSKYGKTPLMWAADNGHSGAVKLLLEREDVNPNQADTEYGQTPLSWAAKNGHESVVKLLWEQEDINPNHADTEYGSTPLSWAAKNGNEDVAKILLQRWDVNPNLADSKYGKTPLSWAAEKGNEGIVKMLLERQDVRAATPDHKSQTPLSLAFSQGHHRIAKVLREWDNANFDIANRRGLTSLLPSAGNVAYNVAELQFRGNSSSARTSDPNNPSVPPPAGHNRRKVAPGSKNSVSMSAKSDFSTELSTQPQPPSPGPLKSQNFTSTHFSATQAPLSFTVDRLFIISSLICLLVFLLYIFSSSSSSDIFIFRKYLSG